MADEIKILNENVKLDVIIANNLHNCRFLADGKDILVKNYSIRSELGSHGHCLILEIPMNQINLTVQKDKS